VNYRIYTKEEINKAIEAVRDNEYDYNYVAIRVCPDMVEVGQTLEPSFVWVDGEITDEELEGTCGINIHSKASYKYFGACMAIIGGYDAEYGEDAGEIIVKDAEVIAIL